MSLLQPKNLRCKHLVRGSSNAIRTNHFSSLSNRTPQIPTVIHVDVTKSPEKQPIPLHNRWHPLIPPTASVTQNQPFRVECIDWTGGQIADTDSADDIASVDLTRVHYLSGPIKVADAEPGDILVVDILDIGALSGYEWGFTGIFDKSNGGGFLTDKYPNAAKAIWNFEGRHATSRHIPGVRLPGLIHPGLIGCAPSEELLQKWNRREAALVATDPNRVPPLATLPNTTGALVGSLTGDDATRAAQEGARTVPPREHGGNCDIKDLSIGSKLYLPVYVVGANLSMGDIHFSQGDGEISFCGAIEMAGYIDLKVGLIKGGMAKYAMINPMFLPGNVKPSYSEFLTFQGISVEYENDDAGIGKDGGTQHYMDAHLAYKNACLNAIRYLGKFGYSEEQAYLLLSAAPVEGRISGIVDIPNVCCTIALPTQIFDFDIKPK